MSQWVDNPFDDIEEEESRRLSPWAVLILLLLIGSMLASLLWPLLLPAVRQRAAPPTPTSWFLQEA
jgi:hypothetical protein